MSDTLLKLRVLLEFLGMAFDNWKHDVWTRDLDEKVFDDSMTLREFYKNRSPSNGSPSHD